MIDQLKKWREEGGKPGKRQNPIEKARNKPTSLRFAINGKCYDCQGQDADPNVSQRIKTCECPDCTLYPVRPYQ